MARILTTYKNPSIADRLAAVTTIEQLAAWRVALQEAYQSGRLKPSEKTVRTWHERLWEKVFALIATAPTPSAACFVYNVTLRWLKPEGMQESLWQLLSARVAQLPNDVERLARQGVTIEGVSTPAQCALAAAVQLARVNGFSQGGPISPGRTYIVGEPPAPSYLPANMVAAAPALRSWKRADIPTRDVLEAYAELKHEFETCSTIAEYSQRPSRLPVEQRLAARFPGCPEKVIWAAMWREDRRGYIEYGINLRWGWLTEQGKAALERIRNGAAA